MRKLPYIIAIISAISTIVGTYSYQICSFWWVLSSVGMLGIILASLLIIWDKEMKKDRDIRDIMFNYFCIAIIIAFSILASLQSRNLYLGLKKQKKLEKTSDSLKVIWQNSINK